MINMKQQNGIAVQGGTSKQQAEIAGS